MKQQIESIRVQFYFLDSLKSNTLTFIPNTKVDEINGEEYVENLYCLEQQKFVPIQQFITKDVLPGLIQSQFPYARVDVLYSSKELS